MRFTLHKMMLLSIALLSLGNLASAQTAPPLVYPVENTGTDYPAPPLPVVADLPVIVPFPDPFAWANDPLGATRSTAFSDWSHHRAEIKAQIEHYEIGLKPAVDPSQISASFSADSTLTVIVTVDGRTLTLTSKITIPAGDGPFPVVIGMNGNSLPATAFTSRNIARMTFSANQVTTYGNPQNSDPYYQLYPDQNIDNSGQYAAWSWGVSRLIDGLYLTKDVNKMDLDHIAVTGCSYAGKMALFAGAFDERVALTIPQESGGGGATNWRYSFTQSGVEGLSQTDHNWFRESMFTDFGGNNVSKLPEDHHMLCAMVAPRALYVTGNTDYVWLSNQSCYVNSRAVQEIYNTLGIGDRFGFCVNGNHGHCAFPASQDAELAYFLDKFMLGNETLSQTIETYPDAFKIVDYERWYQWWGSGDPVLPPEQEVDVDGIWLEAECGVVGSGWTLETNPLASNGKYIVYLDPNFLTASNDPQHIAVYNFTIDEAAGYKIYARLNCPTADDDSYFVKVNNGAYATVNNIVTDGWQWVQLATSNLAAGDHKFTVCYRENGAMFDKLLITTAEIPPKGAGKEATNCVPPPFVYDKENTGAEFPAPTMNGDLNTLPFIQTLPDPFAWADGSGRSINFNDWEKRRNEIKAQIEFYEIGTKPDRPEDITAAYDEETKELSVIVTVGENSLTLKTTVNLPAVGPGVKVPAMIGMNGTGSLPADIFSSRNIVQISYPASQITTYGRPSNNDPYYKLYPELNIDNTGQYSAWAWGLSRLIDGIEIALADRIDLKHIGVTGCSYAGKMALFCGAFDERVALTVSQESGGGGYTAWRVSETVGDVEKLGATDHNWFRESMFNFASANVPHLPVDHHELMAMVAPRALVVTGNEGQVWLADKSGYVASRAVKNIYETLGIGDRFGMLNVGSHAHCSFPAAERAGLEAFVDKFLLDNTTVDTDSIFIYPASYEGYKYKFWMPWANLGRDTDVADFWREAEADCITTGSDFTVATDETASDGKYLATGTVSPEAAPTKAGKIDIPFILADHGNYAIYARVNVTVGTRDSLWVSVDSRTFKKVVITSTNGAWAWVLLGREDLLTGNHLLSIGAATTTGKIDRIYISNGPTAPAGLGGTESTCIEIISSVIFDFENSTIAYQSNTDWNLWNGRNLGAISTADKHGGEKSLELKSTTATDHWRTQAFSPVVELINGDHYQVSFWAKALTTSTGELGEGVMQWGTRAANSLVSSDESKGNQYWGLTTVSGDWKQYTYTGLVAKGTTFQLAIECGSMNDKTYYIDDIEIRNVDLAPLAIIPVKVSGGYSLGQNYPNPSKGVTYIPFEIQKPGYVSLKVYNLFGQEVAELAGKEYQQGSHLITVDSSILPKGIYIYALKTGNFSASKKLLVK